LGKPRVLLADDHVLVAEAIKKLLEPECEVVGIAVDGRALLREAPALNPDVVLLDLNMPLLNGFDAGEQLKQLLPKVKIIVLTMNEDAEIAAETLGKWASGYLLKKSAGSELLQAVQEVLRGEKYVTPAEQQALEALSPRDSTGESARCPGWDSRRRLYPASLRGTWPASRPPQPSVWRPLPEEASSLPAISEWPVPMSARPSPVA